ncbi:MAG TPA: FAD-dependent oxidoreductase [Planctomycetota bacterium]
MIGDPVDVLVIGAGLRGLAAGLRVLREQPDERLAVVEKAPQPGGNTRTQRSNGFLCELGAYGFARADVEPMRALLRQAPAVVEALPSAGTGLVFLGDRLEPVAVDPVPVSFRTGAEELVQACRRELGPRLHLGRAATHIEPGREGFVVTLGGEVPTPIAARRIVLALPVAEACHLLERFDHALAAAAGRLQLEPRGFAFFGGSTNEAPELRGYGVVPGDHVDTPVAEVIYCTEVFPGRALPGRFLVRCELVGAALARDDAAALATAEAELRRWTGVSAHFGFTKLHRFTVEVQDGAFVECRARVQQFAARLPGLSFA